MAHPIPSKAAVAGHPIHPMLIPFPIAFVSAALLTDVVFAFTRDSGWATASAWLLGAAGLTGVVAALAGLVDYLGVAHIRAHGQARRHAWGNGILLVLVATNFVLRLIDTTGTVVATGVAISVVSTAILAYTGWLGGELSYRHMIGANPHGGGH